jgi:hypothetical protein
VAGHRLPRQRIGLGRFVVGELLSGRLCRHFPPNWSDGRLGAERLRIQPPRLGNQACKLVVFRQLGCDLLTPAIEVEPPPGPAVARRTEIAVVSRLHDVPVGPRGKKTLPQKPSSTGMPSPRKRVASIVRSQPRRIRPTSVASIRNSLVAAEACLGTTEK